MMSYPFNNRRYNCNQSNPSMNNCSYYNQNNGYGNQMPQMTNMYGGGGYSPMQTQMQSQMRMQQMNQNVNGTPRVTILPAGQQLDPNMKVIKLNWGDLLAGGNSGNSSNNCMQNGGHGLKVAMVQGNGDMTANAPGLRCTLNGQVPKNAIVHVMNINPYQNIL